MSFDVLFKTQPHVVKLLNNSYKKNRLVHAYLFEGARGTAKGDAALYLASLLLCTSNKKPCLSCNDCRMISNQTHFNIIDIVAEGNVIRKEQIENLIKEFSLKSTDGRSRIFIINEIDKATAAAANSLLKFLEEAGENNYGVLLTENLLNVLPTIRSRSQIVNFSQLLPKTIAKRLIDFGVEEEISYILAHITNDEEDCLKMINEGKILDIIEVVKAIGASLISKKRAPLLVFFENGDVLLTEKDKRYHNIFLDLMVIFLGDLLYLILGDNDKIVFKETNNQLTLTNISPENIIREIEKILGYKHKIRYNVNIELYYTQLFSMLEL